MRKGAVAGAVAGEKWSAAAGSGVVGCSSDRWLSAGQLQVADGRRKLGNWPLGLGRKDAWPLNLGSGGLAVGTGCASGCWNCER